MPRMVLKDEQWSKLKPILLFCRINDKPELRMTLEGILYRIRTGIQWRDLPPEFGLWASIYKRFNEWAKSGKWELVFKIASNNPDLEWLFIDGSIVKAHQHSSGASKDSKEGDHAIGKSVAGNTTKIHMVVDSLGLPVNFEITGGQVHDVKVASSLLSPMLPRVEALIADKGYDSQALRDEIEQNGAKPNIPKRKGAKEELKNMDWNLYKIRHLVENIFARLKHYRAIATRYDKLARNYKATLLLTCSLLWLT